MNSIRVSILSILILLASIIAGCAAQESETLYDLSETHEIPRAGLSINHPEGWIAETALDFTVISELEEDHAPRFVNWITPEGYQITIENLSALKLGLAEDFTLEDVHYENIEFYDWEEPVVVSETELLGAPAISVQGYSNRCPGWYHQISTIHDGQAIIIAVVASSEAKIMEFEPTWDRMLQSVTLAGG